MRANPIVQAAVTLLLQYHFFVLFMIGGIFEGILFPITDMRKFKFAVLAVTPFLLLGTFPQNGDEKEKLSARIQLIAVVAFGILVAVHSGPGLTARCVLSAMTPFLFLLIAPRVLEKKHYMILFWFVSILAAAHALSQLSFIVAQTQQFFGYNVNMPHGRLLHLPQTAWIQNLDGYTGGWFTNPNCLASYVMAVPAISFFLAQREVTSGKFARIAALLMGLVVLTSLLLTFSRAAILSTLIGFLPVCVAMLKRKGVPAFASFAGVLTAFALGFVALMSLTTLTDPFSLSGRQDLWKVAMAGFRNLPILGHGPFNAIGVVETPHNVFLANLIFYGVPGFIAFIVMIGSCLWMGWKAYRRQPDTGFLSLLGFISSYVLVYSQVEYVLSCSYSFSNSVALLLLGYLVSAFRNQSEPAPPADSTAHSETRKHALAT